MRWVRLGLVVLALASAFVGVWALPAPRSFYDNFPGFGHHWVSMLSPYNEHLIRDVGSLNLALAVIVAWAAWTLDRRLIVAASVGYLANAIPHFVFHLTHLDHFEPADAIAQTASLAAVVLIPLAILATIGRTRT